MFQLTARKGILLATSMLVACGGGGGDGGGVGSVSATAVITDDNALPVTQEVFASSAFAQSFALGFGLGLDDDAFAANAADGAADANANAAVASYAAALIDGLTNDSQSDAPATFVPAALEACSQGGFADVTETGGAESAQLEITFSNCEGYGDQGAELPGVVNGRMVVNVSNPSPFGADFSVNIDGLSAVDGDDSVFLDGRFNGTVTFDSGVTYIDVLMSTNSFYALENGVESELINYEFNIRMTEGSIRQGFSGGLDGSGFDGIISFDTKVRLRLTYSVATYTNGELHIKGVDNAAIRIIANSTDYPAVDIDLDGDDVTDSQPTWSWNDIMLMVDL